MRPGPTSLRPGPTSLRPRRPRSRTKVSIRHVSDVSAGSGSGVAGVIGVRAGEWRGACRGGTRGVVHRGGTPGHVHRAMYTGPCPYRALSHYWPCLITGLAWPHRHYRPGLTGITDPHPGLPALADPPRSKLSNIGLAWFPDTCAPFWGHCFCTPVSGFSRTFSEIQMTSAGSLSFLSLTTRPRLTPVFGQTRRRSRIKMRILPWSDTWDPGHVHCRQKLTVLDPF